MSKYLKSLLIALKYKFHFVEVYCTVFPKIVYIKAIRDYIVFCPKCGEYICRDGICSNPICPEEIKNYEN
jgi:hypothetical protein